MKLLHCSDLHKLSSFHKKITDHLWEMYIPEFQRVMVETQTRAVDHHAACDDLSYSTGMG